MLVPQLEVELKTEAAQRFGLTPGNVRQAATTLVKGAKAGETCDEHPMAVVILSVLVTSTVLNLFLKPALYLRYGKAGSRLEHKPAGD